MFLQRNWKYFQYFQSIFANQLLCNSHCSFDRAMRVEETTLAYQLSSTLFPFDPGFRPKAVTPLTGSIWARETVHLHHTYPDEFEVSAPESKYSYAFRICCAQIHDSLFHCRDMSEDEDMKKVTNTEACALRKYEFIRNSKVVYQICACNYKNLILHC